MSGWIPHKVSFAILFIGCSSIYNVIYLIMNSYFNILESMGKKGHYDIYKTPLLWISNVKFIIDLSNAIVVLCVPSSVDWILVSVYYFVGSSAFFVLVCVLAMSTLRVTQEMSSVSKGVAKGNRGSTHGTVVGFAAAARRIKLSTLALCFNLFPATPLLLGLFAYWIQQRFDFGTNPYPDDMPWYLGLFLDVVFLADLGCHLLFYFLYIHRRVDLTTKVSNKVKDTLFLAIFFAPVQKFRRQSSSSDVLELNISKDNSKDVSKEASKDLEAR